MASNMQILWRVNTIFLVGVLMLFGMVRLSSAGSYGYGYSPAPTNNRYAFKASKWTLAHATFYGDDSASATNGGACGYGNLFNNGYGTDTAALSSVMFNNGNSCGSCYQLKCVESKWCIGGGYSGSSPTITITATNLCPPNWYEPSDNGGWCNPPREHFDLSKPAFNKLALTQGGIVPVQYRRVPCPRKGGIRFTFEGNDYWLLVYTMNVGGAGDISQMWVKGTKTGWISMSHNWGVTYQAFAKLGGQSLTFKVKCGVTGEIVIANNVTPPYWSTGSSYQSKVNFRSS